MTFNSSHFTNKSHCEYSWGPSCRSLLCVGGSALYALTVTIRTSSHTNLNLISMQESWHAGSTVSMLIDVNGPVTLRLWRSQSSVWSSGPAPWWGWWGYCEAWGTWTVVDADQQVFTTPITRRRVQAPIYCLSWAVSWLIVKCRHSAIFLPFYALSNPLQICFPPLIYEWKYAHVVLQERDLDKGIWLAFCPFHN